MGAGLRQRRMNCASTTERWTQRLKSGTSRFGRRIGRRSRRRRGRGRRGGGNRSRVGGRLRSWLGRRDGNRPGDWRTGACPGGNRRTQGCRRCLRMPGFLPGLRSTFARGRGLVRRRLLGFRDRVSHSGNFSNRTGRFRSFRSRLFFVSAVVVPTNVISVGAVIVAVVVYRSASWDARCKQAISQRYRDLFVDRAGMRLLFLHAQVRQQVENDARFYFKLPRQLVDPDFFHRRDC